MILLSDFPPKRLYDRSEAAKALPAADMIGPVALAYLAPELFRPAPGPAVEQLHVEHPGLRALENLCSPKDRNEASIDVLTSPVFAIREGGDIIAASGYVAWPRNTAQLAILTAPRARGRGLAKAAAPATSHTPSPLGCCRSGARGYRHRSG